MGGGSQFNCKKNNFVWSEMEPLCKHTPTHAHTTHTDTHRSLNDCGRRCQRNRGGIKPKYWSCDCLSPLCFFCCSTWLFFHLQTLICSLFSAHPPTSPHSSLRRINRLGIPPRAATAAQRTQQEWYLSVLALPQPLPLKPEHTYFFLKEVCKSGRRTPKINVSRGV